MSSPHQQAGGALGKCLGGTGHWTGTFVATPSLASPNLPPCLTKPDEAWRHLQSERVRALRLTTVRAVHLPFDKRATSFVHASQPTPLVVS